MLLLKMWLRKAIDVLANRSYDIGQACHTTEWEVGLLQEKTVKDFETDQG